MIERNEETVDRTRNPVATVRRMFDAFRAGDIDALVETVHPESRWIYYGANPQIGIAEFTGRAAVRKFFERILSRLEVTAFVTDEFVVQEATVVIFGSESGIVRSTGRHFRNEWAQKYIVKDGLITGMTEYNIQVEPRG